MTAEVARALGNVLVMITLAPFASFLVLYITRTPRWYKTDYGRFVVCFAAVVTLQLSLGIVRLFTEVDAGWFLILRLVSFMCIPLVGFWQLALLLKAQKESRTLQRGWTCPHCQTFNEATRWECRRCGVAKE